MSITRRARGQGNRNLKTAVGHNLLPILSTESRLVLGRKKKKQAYLFFAPDPQHRVVKNFMRHKAGRSLTRELVVFYWQKQEL